MLPRYLVKPCLPRNFVPRSCSPIPFEINLFDNRQFLVRIIAADNSIPVHEE